SFSYSHKVNQATALEYWFEFKGQTVRFGRQKKPKQTIKDTLTEGEITAMFLSCKNIRERAMLAVLSYSGVRPKEFCKIKRKHINFGTNELTVEAGKENKDRVIYVSADCINILVEYLAKFPKQPEDFMFLTADKRHCQYRASCLRKFIHVLARRAKIAKRVYPYILRHSLAINMINRGCDIFTIKNQLGHSLIETTLLYLNSLGYGLKNCYERFCPSYT
ncbi:MAG: tyrosine-type recombinase/integrase, partial [Patescibacteria group bacterium]|nr:tyrosine-type recombinase/integrase [Patescibacteria group bacterium]